MTRMLSLSKAVSRPFVKKKIRGGKRILRIINNWRESAETSLDWHRLQQYQYDYERVVHPWTVYAGARISPPKKFRNEIILGLLQRYEHWDAQLQNIGEPYYLKIWLYDQMFFESQIVAAIRERIHLYEKLTFQQADRKSIFPLQHFANNAVKYPKFQWTPVFDVSDPDYPRRDLVWVGHVNND